MSDDADRQRFTYEQGTSP